MDLYNASKISIHQIQIQFLNINQEFQKFFYKFVFRTSAVRVLMKHLPYVVSTLSAVRVSEISAALSAVSVNEIFKF